MAGLIMLGVGLVMALFAVGSALRPTPPVEVFWG